MRSNIENAKLRNCEMHAHTHTLGTLADAAGTITFEHPDMMIITPTAARTLTMPADDATKRGRIFVIINGAAITHAITINNASAAAVGTIAAAKIGLVLLAPDGTWKVLSGA